MGPQPFQVVLDSDATIVAYKDPLDLLGYGDKGEAILGLNWFDLFIEDDDRESIKEVFKSLMVLKSHTFETFQNDIKKQDGTHIYMDFHNEVLEKDGQRFLESYGFEHYLDYLSICKPTVFPSLIR